VNARWDVRTRSGALVDNLDALGQVLGGVTAETAAKMLLAEPAADCAPPALLAEAKRVCAALETKKAQGTHKPGGGTPPPIANGSFVQFGNTRGRVDLVVRTGKVPGVDDDVEGSKDSPAVRVVIWDKDGDGYKPSRRKVGKMAHTLKRIAPLTRTGGKSTGGVDLVGMLAAHEARNLPPHARVTGAAVKAVYDRGLAGWPGFERTTLTREQWAAGRVKSFLAVAAGDAPSHRPRDVGLLSKSHPAHPQYRPGQTVRIKAADIERDLAMFAE
jgi:hypothetical protein